jgi:hypothetical protein
MGSKKEIKGADDIRKSRAEKQRRIEQAKQIQKQKQRKK